MIKITKEEFIGLDNEDKWKNYIGMKQGRNTLQITNNALNSQMKSMQHHLKHIARKIMFLLDHPNSQTFMSIERKKYDFKPDLTTKEEVQNDKED